MKKILILVTLVFLSGCVSPIKEHPVEYSSTEATPILEPSTRVGNYLEFSAGQFIEKK